MLRYALLAMVSCGTLIVAAFVGGAQAPNTQIRIATFAVDASPPIGSPLAYDPTKEIQMPLSCRGVVILGGERPIVLCAVDWIGIGNGGNQEFRARLAQAAGTTPEYVAVHTLHQHDAPRCDFTADAMAREQGVLNGRYDSVFNRKVLTDAAQAVQDALEKAQPVTHVGTGLAPVEKVASNRRILGPDGKVQFTRYTACKDPKIRAMPEGVIDPKVKLIAFWNGDTPLAVLTYYATHPQSYYRTGKANPDFPGMAREDRQAATGVFHVHFNGAGGNLGAGKYNDGAPENRQVLADRLAAGMKAAWDRSEKSPVTAKDVGWTIAPVRLPLAKHLKEDRLRDELMNPQGDPSERSYAASRLAWVKRSQAGETIPLTSLQVGPARVLHMPGELFVEYQLAAAEMRPDLFVAMAAYGDYGTGYIGTEVGYTQGGYETSERASLVDATVEKVLVDGMRKLLDAPNARIKPLGVEAAQTEAEAAKHRAKNDN